MIVGLDESPEVVAIVPTLGRSPERLERCLASVRAQEGDIRIAIIVVANGPTDDDALPDATLLEPGYNLGWAGGLAFGRSVAGEPAFLWLVQDDMVPATDCLTLLRAASDGHAMVSPVAIEGEGDGTTIPYGSGGFLDEDGDVREWYPRTNLPPGELVGHEELGYLASRGMLVRTADWDLVGGMDPGFYPAMFADVSFCTALRAAGRTFRLVPGATTRHEGNGSTGGAYATFLFEHNRERFRRGSAGRRIDNRIPPKVVESISVSAADALQSLGARYAALHAAHLALRAEVDHLRAVEWRAALLADEVHSLRTSTSWRVTSGLRALGALRPHRR